MNKKLGLLFAGVFTAACGLVAAEPVLYTLETSHSFTNFELVHQGMSSWRGKFNKMSGRVWLDREGKTGTLFQNDGSVRLLIDFEAFLGAIVPDPPTAPPPRAAR